MKERNDEQNIESNGRADRKLLINIKSTYRDVGVFFRMYKLGEEQDKVSGIGDKQAYGIL